ncbi:MAG: colicin D domain-containing protein [Sciscionella sp.]
MGGGLRVDPGDYVAASTTIGSQVAGTVSNAAAAVTSTLCGCGGMAGSDPAGTGWAAGYDAAAESVLAATQDAINGSRQLAALLEQTGFNYSRAESESTYGHAPPPLDTTVYAGQHASLGPVPAAAGHNPPSPPGGWTLVQAAVRRAWPNGHQDRLRAAATAWHDGADTLIDASFGVADAVACIAQQSSPETDTAITVCNRLRDNLDELAATGTSLASACTDYAGHLDDAHSQIEHELINLLEWSAAVQVTGAVLSALSFGAAEAPTQAEQAARIVTTGGKIATIIDRLGQLATTTAASITTLTARAADITTSLKPLLTAERVIAATEAVQAAKTAGTAQELALAELEEAAQIERLPLKAPLRQVESHYKHAATFGVTAPRSATGFKQFAQAMSDFVTDESTVRVSGSYRRSPAILNYNTESRLVVVQHSDGSFWSAWKMTFKQMQHVLADRSLGGG